LDEGIPNPPAGQHFAVSASTLLLLLLLVLLL
jgi:hypothetical protein